MRIKEILITIGELSEIENIDVTFEEFLDVMSEGHTVDETVEIIKGKI